MQVEPFEIERFYERWEFRAELMLSSSDCESLSVGELLALEPAAAERLQALRLGYTEVPGSPELRGAIADSYESLAPEDVLTLAAAEEGIFLAHHALLDSGDHAVIESPCYGSAASLARSTGASVSLWERHHEDGWEHDLDALAKLIGPTTKLLYINSPHNPTGRQMSQAVFERVLECCREHSLILLSDEVYRGLEHDPAIALPAACDAYERAISLGTVSKAYGLPGLRIGWLASRDRGLLAQIKELKLYTTICSSAPSELLVALALRARERLIARSRALVLANLPLVAELMVDHAELLSWVAPDAGPIGFPRVAGDFDVQRWCEELAERSGVLLLPGAVYGRPRHLRIGFGRAEVPQALARLSAELAERPPI